MPKEKNSNKQKDNNKKNRIGKKYIFLILFIITLLLLFIISVVFSLLNMNNNNIIKGVYINNVDASKMSKEEATTFITSIISSKQNKNIVLSYPSNTEDTPNTEASSVQEDVSFESLSINYDVASAVNEAYAIGRSGNIFQNNFEILMLLFNKKNINIPINIDDDKVNELIYNISGNLPNKVVQSSYYIDDSNLIITSGTRGNAVDENAFKNNLNSLLYNIAVTDNYLIIPIKSTEPNKIDIDNIYNEVFKEAKNAYYEENPFKVYAEVKGVSFDKEAAKNVISTPQSEYTIPLIFTNPEISLKDLNVNVFPDLLGAFTTKYDVTNVDRSTNLKLAAQKISGKILSPGEEFSYNTTVGERSISAGYKEAKIYSNGEVVDGLGGGICQISSTLYNAVVFANLDVTQRYNHQFITSYVSAGRDATVVYGAKDFKFKNSRSYPIKIIMNVKNGVASAEIYGLKEPTEYNIDFSVETVSTLTPTVQYEKDDSLGIGMEKIKRNGTNGKIVKVYKITKLDGKVIDRKLLSQDTYNAMTKIILIGNSPISTTSEEPKNLEINIPTPSVKQEPEPIVPETNNEIPASTTPETPASEKTSTETLNETE